MSTHMINKAKAYNKGVQASHSKSKRSCPYQQPNLQKWWFAGYDDHTDGKVVVKGDWWEPAE